MTISERLRALREKRGLSQYKLAALAKLPRSTLIRIEHGQVEPRISTLRRIAKALGVEAGEFLK